MNAGNFSVERTPLLGLPLITTVLLGDDRGSFHEAWREDSFRDLGLDVRFVQDNQSSSRRGVLRGLHWQGPPSPQGKLVRCTLGRIRDVVVDIRAGSPTWGRHEVVELEGGPAGAGGRPGNPRLLYVPPGFAHGFLALTEGAQVLYRVTAYWDRAAEGCIAFDDPDLGIDWRWKGPPVVSARDRAGIRFAQYGERPAFRWEGAR